MSKKTGAIVSIASACMLCVPTIAFAFGNASAPMQDGASEAGKSLTASVERASKAPTAEMQALAEGIGSPEAALSLEAESAFEPAQEEYTETAAPTYAYHYGFVDNDGNGTCDNYEYGYCDGYGNGCGTGYGNGYGYCGGGQNDCYGNGYGIQNGNGYQGGHHEGNRHESGHHGGECW